MLEVVQRRGGRALGSAVMNTAVPGTRSGGYSNSTVTED